MNNWHSELAYAHGVPRLNGRIRSRPADFVVEELPLFEASNEGEHVLLNVRKRGQNTAWVAQQLGRFAGVAPRAVSYAGLKDRHAVATQRFTIHMPGLETPDFSQFEVQGVEILTVGRHNRKLRRGALAGNRFEITVRELEGDREGLAERLAEVERRGVPNYFGEQRFGHAAGNIGRAEEMLLGGRRVPRKQRGIYLSAARSYLFNELLAARVVDGSWDQALEGEWFQLAGRSAVFQEPGIDDVLRQRMEDGEIDPTGSLPGGSMPQRVSAVEQRTLDSFSAWVVALDRAGVAARRRSLRLRPQQMSWDLSEREMRLAFALPPGCYATAVLREIVRCDPG